MALGAGPLSIAGARRLPLADRSPVGGNARAAEVRRAPSGGARTAESARGEVLGGLGSARRAARADRRACLHDLLAGGRLEPCGSQSARTPATRGGDLAR